MFAVEYLAGSSSHTLPNRRMSPKPPATQCRWASSWIVELSPYVKGKTSVALNRLVIP